MTTHDVYYHLSKVQRRLRRENAMQKLWRKLFPNRISLIVTILFSIFCIWLALGAPMP